MVTQSLTRFWETRMPPVFALKTVGWMTDRAGQSSGYQSLFCGLLQRNRRLQRQYWTIFHQSGNRKTLRAGFSVDYHC